LIKDAIERKKKIEFHYYGPGGDNTRILEPCLLIFEWSSWYVWGYCLLRDDFRMFKLNRMDQIRCTNEDSEKREIPLYQMDPRRVQWTNEVEVTAEFDQSMKWRLIEEFGINSFSENADGSLLMNVGWSDQESLFSWLLGFRDCVRIIEPVEYQKDFLNLLERIKNLY
jgi:predicted DNA-binding transcriptional regulator YafY